MNGQSGQQRTPIGQLSSNRRRGKEEQQQSN